MVKGRKRKSGLVGKLALGVAVLGTLVGCGSKQNNELIYHEDLGVYAPKNYQVENATEVNKDLINSDYTNLQMVENQEKYVFPGANKRFTFIGQTHQDPLKDLRRDSLNLFEEMSVTLGKYRAANSQNNIYYLLDSLDKSSGLGDVYGEGVFSQEISESAKNFQIEKLTNSISNYSRNSDISCDFISDNNLSTKEGISEYLSNNSIKDLLGNFAASLGNEKDYYWNQYQNLVKEEVKRISGDSFGEPSAVLRMVYEGRINLLPFEDQRIHDKTFKLLEKSYEGQFIHPRLDKYIFDKRENSFIRRFSESPSNHAYVIIGRSHYFLDNIQEWNKRHPKKTISLENLIISKNKYFPSIDKKSSLLNFPTSGYKAKNK